MRLFFGLILSISILSFSSCIEIIDDISVNSDGSGTFRYNVNLSSSKVKINSILALDSLDGKKVPNKLDIQNILDRVVSSMKEKEGISNVSFSSDYTDFIFKIECDFESLNLLQKAIKEVVKMESKQKEIPELEQTWLTYEEDKLVRSIPQITIKKTKEINKNEIELLKTGTYTSITRFDREVDHFDNENGLVSKNKKAVMIRIDPYSLTQNVNLLDNSIYLVKTD